ncbi:replication initiation factor domain-containing protein [Oryzomonas rubra]|nr:replication initiation factor domain-containing protein [Oryzomonas rubra]
MKKTTITNDHTKVNSPVGSAGFSPSGGIPGGTAEPSSGMASPVTRHALNPPADNYELLNCGIDSLDLGLFVTWNDQWSKTRELLETGKQLAQEGKLLPETTDLARQYQHLPSGKPPNYRYGIRFLEYLAFIAKSDSYRTSPNVYISLTSSVLWHESFSTILELLTFDLEHFGGTIDRIQPSRCDLAVDFRLTPPPNFQFLEQYTVSRSRKVSTHINSGILETYYCGSPAAPVRLRIYDKGKEIQISNKHWFLDLWHTDDPANIWRVEYQLRRPFLHQYRINTLEDLWEKIGGMWAYLTGEWFSLRLPDNDKAERRTIHLWWWAAVQESGNILGVNNGERRRFDSDNPQQIDKILPHVFSRMITIAALSGIKDRKASISKLLELLDKYGSETTFREKLNEKLLKLGYRGTLGGADDDDLPF